MNEIELQLAAAQQILEIRQRQYDRLVAAGQAVEESIREASQIGLIKSRLEFDLLELRLRQYQTGQQEGRARD